MRRTDQRRVSLLVGCSVTALRGAMGALARWWLQTAHPATGGQFPWTTFLINLIGSGLLAALPLVPAARRRPWFGVFVGTGLLGGFTTMSAASVDTLTLLRGDHFVVASAYCLGTLAAALAVVLLVDILTTVAERADAEAEAEEWGE